MLDREVQRLRDRHVSYSEGAGFPPRQAVQRRRCRPLNRRTERRSPVEEFRSPDDDLSALVSDLRPRYNDQLVPPGGPDPRPPPPSELGRDPWMRRRRALPLLRRGGVGRRSSVRLEEQRGTRRAPRVPSGGKVRASPAGPRPHPLLGVGAQAWLLRRRRRPRTAGLHARLAQVRRGVRSFVVRLRRDQDCKSHNLHRQ